MSITLSGTKTCTVAVSPVHTAAAITTLMATAVENLTVANLTFLQACCQRKAGGEEPAATLTSLFS